VWIEKQGHEEQLWEQDLLLQQESIQQRGRLQVKVLWEWEREQQQQSFLGSR
jgi:hypothetical protein